MTTSPHSLSPHQAADRYLQMARTDGVAGVYEQACDEGSDSLTLLRLVRLLKALPPPVAYPRSKRRNPWRLAAAQRRSLTIQAWREGVQPSVIAATLEISEDTVRRHGRAWDRDHEAAIAEVLNRALGEQVESDEELDEQEPLDWFQHVLEVGKFDVVERFLAGVISELIRLLKELRGERDER